ncbi:M1 family metallopeptidase [Lysobacter sp. HDW10]|uniref:M1 family metallopeptidase n=1 Tax=Lysobacter sp. HDW10 TaxID=2714936 RepID=UPI00140D8EB1|nr:M1 family metallopeptidase [Lysobacter sp. HDW10]QIK81972.1 M1 family metallopeptidase [Lysobacter sp. HDW10]
MRKHVLTLILAGATAPAFAIDYTATSGLGMTLEQQSTRFDVAELSFKVDPTKKTLAGEARLTFTPKHAIQQFAIELDPRYALSRFEVNGKVLSKSEYSWKEGRISFPVAASANTAFEVKLVYAGSPQVAKRAPWDGGIVWAKTPSGQPWIATAVEGEGCDLLWPCVDHPMGKPLQVIQHITVPQGLVAASNGVFLGESSKDGWTTYNWKATEPTTYAIALNIAPYDTLKSNYQSRFGNTLPMVFYYLKGNDAKARGLYEELPLYLNFFEEVVGPYPFPKDKVGIVETPHLGMEHQTINAYGNGYKKDINGYDWLMNHEFAHEWFGNQITNADWDDMWLHEGFAMYMQPLYLEWLRGRVNYDAEMLRQRGLIRNAHAMVSGKPRPHGEAAAEAIDPGTDIYYKGAWILHTLRNQIGDAAFRRSMRELVYGRNDPKPGNFKPRYATTNDYVAIVDKITGKKWAWFFDAYVREAKIPALVATQSGHRVNVEWQTGNGKPFPLPIDVRVGNRVVKLPMNQGKGSFELKPFETYTLDPDSKVLKDQPEIAAWRKDEAERAAVAAAAAAAAKRGK